MEAVGRHIRNVADSISKEDVQVTGFYLMRNFVRVEFQRAKLSPAAIEIEPSEVFENNDDDGADDICKRCDLALHIRSLPYTSLLERLSDPSNNQDLKDCGETLRIISKHFEQSHERYLVHLLSKRIELSNISYKDFSDLLRDFFQHGANQCDIATLFYFCSDVLIRCVRSGLGPLARKLFTWALRFLLGNVCQWVYENGGWERVLSNVYKVTRRLITIAFLTVATLCGIVFLKNNWK